MDWPVQQGVLRLGNLPLHKGGVLRDACLSWRAHGVLSPARDNAVLYPTSFGNQHAEMEWALGRDGILDPSRWFIVIPDMFGNGMSSSPSNGPWPGLVTAWDNVAAQHRQHQRAEHERGGQLVAHERGRHRQAAGQERHAAEHQQDIDEAGADHMTGDEIALAASRGADRTRHLR